MKKLWPVFLLLALLLSACKPYSTDISDLDCTYKLGFLVDKDDPNGEDAWYLRTVDFAADTVRDIYLEDGFYGELVYGDAMQDMRLIFFADDGMRRTCKLSPDGSLGKAEFVSQEYHPRVTDAKFEGGNEYDQFGFLDGFLRTWTNYNSDVLSYYPDGRVAGIIERDTGKATADYFYKDENGKLVTVMRKMRGYTLGIEGAKGNWLPVLDFGEDTAIHKISHAGWIDGANLLIIGFDAKENAAFYHLNLAERSLRLLKTARGKTMRATADADPSNSHITITPDGRYAAYRPFSGLILAVDLHTGKRCSVYNAAFDYGEDGVGISSGDIQFWY